MRVRRINKVVYLAGEVDKLDRWLHGMYIRGRCAPRKNA